MSRILKVGDTVHVGDRQTTVNLNVGGLWVVLESATGMRTVPTSRIMWDEKLLRFVLSPKEAGGE